MNALDCRFTVDLHWITSFEKMLQLSQYHNGADFNSLYTYHPQRQLSISIYSNLLAMRYITYDNSWKNNFRIE